MRLTVVVSLTLFEAKGKRDRLGMFEVGIARVKAE